MLQHLGDISFPPPVRPPNYIFRNKKTDLSTKELIARLAYNLHLLICQREAFKDFFKIIDCDPFCRCCDFATIEVSDSKSTKRALHLPKWTFASSFMFLLDELEKRKVELALIRGDTSGECYEALNRAKSLELVEKFNIQPHGDELDSHDLLVYNLNKSHGIKMTGKFKEHDERQSHVSNSQQQQTPFVPKPIFNAKGSLDSEIQKGASCTTTLHDSSESMVLGNSNVSFAQLGMNSEPGFDYNNRPALQRQNCFVDQKPEDISPHGLEKISFNSLFHKVRSFYTEHTGVKEQIYSVFDSIYAQLVFGWSKAVATKNGIMPHGSGPDLSCSATVASEESMLSPYQQSSFRYAEWLLCERNTLLNDTFYAEYQHKFPTGVLVIEGNIVQMYAAATNEVYDQRAVIATFISWTSVYPSESNAFESVPTLVRCPLVKRELRSMLLSALNRFRQKAKIPVKSTSQGQPLQVVDGLDEDLPANL